MASGCSPALLAGSRRRSQTSPARPPTSRPHSCRSCAIAVTEMRWLLLKDLQILRRSPLLVALLVLYPILLAALVGFAVTSGPSKPRVALVNELPKSQRQVALGGEKVNLS